MTSDNIKSGVYLVAIAAAGYVAYQAYKKGKGMADGMAEMWNMGAQQVEQFSADAQTAIANNIVAPFEQGQAWVDAGQPVNQNKSFNELMYGNYGYTGQDGTGQVVSDGEWLSNEEARRYSAAAFGVYPSVFGSNGQKGVTGTW